MTPAQRAAVVGYQADPAHPGVVAFGLLAVLALGCALGWAARGERPERTVERVEVKHEVAPCYLGELPALAPVPEVKCRASYGGDCTAAIRPGRVVVDGQAWADYVRASEAAATACTRFWFECDGGER